MMRGTTIAVTMFLGAVTARAGDPTAVNAVLDGMEWLPSSHQYGSACVRLGGRPIIVIDPAALSPEQCEPKAALVLLTHTHDDHLDVGTIARIAAKGASVVAPVAARDPLAPLASSRSDLRLLSAVAGQTLDLEGVRVTPVAAYNTVSRAHPRQAGGLGYLIERAGVRIYHTGDSSFVPEMKSLVGIDIAIAAIRPPYQMSGAEALELTLALKPQALVPVHWLAAEQPEIDAIRAGIPSATRLVLLPTGSASRKP